MSFNNDTGMSEANPNQSPCDDKTKSCDLCVRTDVMERNLDDLLEKYVDFQNKHAEGKRNANPINRQEMQVKR